MPTTILITGANRGIGLEAAAQCAASEHFDKVILTVRSADKGPAAIAAAAAQAGKPEALFAFQTIDLESHTSVRAAVKSLPRLDAVVLNAGGLGSIGGVGFTPEALRKTIRMFTNKILN